MDLENILLQLVTMEPAPRVIQHILSIKEDKNLVVFGFEWDWWDSRNKAHTGEHMLPTMKPSTRPTVSTTSQ